MQDQFFINIDHPVIHHHRIYGQAILPGLAYIDMVYQFFAEKGFDHTTLTLYDLSIYHPLIIAEGTDILLSVEAVEDGPGRWQVLIDGQEQQNGQPAAGKKRYVRASMQQTAPVVFTEVLDTAGVEQQAVSTIQLEDIYTACRSREMVHTGLMKASGRIYNTGEATIMNIAAIGVPDVMYHPALIDASAIGGAAAISHLIAGEERLFLPLFYGSFRAAGLLQQECWVRILTGTVQRKEELISFTLEFFNAAGQKMAELKNFSSKLVRDTGLIDPERSAVQQLPEDRPAVAADTGGRAFTAAENLLRQWLAERLGIPVRQIDVQAGYYEMGLDSPGLLELVQALEKKLEITLSPTLLFEYTNITALAGYLAVECPHRFVKDTAVQEPVSGIPAAAAPKPVYRASAGREDIAVIAMEGRFPGAAGVKEFWKNLQEGRDGITAVPEDRWRLGDYLDDSLQQGKAFCKWGGFVDDVTMFDPLFFNISPREAASMHPNERLFLETVWHLLERAGYTRELLQEKYQSKVGVFAGAMHQQYQPLAPDIARDSLLMLHSYSAIVNRVSYFFNLQGPSVAVDTMCSSALTALNMACESIAGGQCRMAIVGGVNLSLHPGKYIGLGIAQMLGSHINSRSFADGDGYLPAEAVGAVLLKPLSEAEHDNDTILAVIRSTAVNHGGHSNGYSVPNVQAQVQLMQDNFKASGIPVSSISYVEAAANGSALGDAIEMTALNKVFGKPAPGKNPCAIGTVKSNIGHAEAASGITQLIKTVLQLQHKKLVPVIHTGKLNPNIHFEGTSFYLQQELSDWPASGTDPRRAAISSFGAGGSNAHVIIEEYVSPAGVRKLPDHIPPQVILLSAKDRERLEAAVAQLLLFVTNEKEVWLPDLAYTLQAGRETMACRMALVADSPETLAQGLQAALQLIRDDASSDGTIFLHTKESAGMEIADLLSGQIAITVANALIAENNPEKLAHYWVKGGKVRWEQLHKELPVRKIELPVYPFGKRRCWIEDAPVITPLKTPPPAMQEETGGNNEEVIGILARLLGLQPSEIDRHKPLQQYGFDSILQVQLLQLLQSHGFSVTDFDRLALRGTAQDICMALQPVLQQQQPVPAVRKPATRQFPELLHLNQVKKGRPVFWFHPVLGGVESYMRIAQHCNRPFYGVQARGWMTDRMPLQGIQAMAAYYIHAIQSVQPTGPYDLGGYSLGGILAYEITRQLQEMGETVHSIVMLDAVYSPELKMDALDGSHKTGILQAVNMMLFSSVIHEPEKIHDTLIHRDAISMDITDEVYFERMMELANQRGMNKTSAQLHQLIAHSTKLQRGYQLDSYSVQSLPYPEEVKCYFFRNDSGLFYGELSPYFTMSDTAYAALDHLNYWQEWERQLPHFTMMDAPSPNHMMLLTSRESCDQIIMFCEKLYAGKQVIFEQLVK